jgi:catechol 2,3-dioxygenase-like lactoylglutathione lyase family enzyme
VTQTPEGRRPRTTIRFLFNVCNDVAAMRRFYVDVLGMQEAAFQDTPAWGWLSLQCDGFQAMWFRGAGKLPMPAEWASQPGWEGGTAEVASWGVEIPEERFAEVHRRLVAAGAPLFEPKPGWRQDSYWGLSVRDPAGATVEVYATPKTRPASTTWPD